jgi:hypothetical protein
LWRASGDDRLASVQPERELEIVGDPSQIGDTGAGESRTEDVDGFTISFVSFADLNRVHEARWQQLDDRGDGSGVSRSACAR